MTERTIKTRIIHKHAQEADWIKATGFTPKQAELIVYDPDDAHPYSRCKIGDGVTNINDLDFVLPTYDATADEGKFLRIVNGAPAWVTIEDGDEV